MRKGRFAGLSDRGQEPVTPPELAELFLFDFAPAAGEDDARAAADVRHGQLSLPAAGSHVLWQELLAEIGTARRRNGSRYALLISCGRLLCSRQAHRLKPHWRALTAGHARRRQRG